MRSRTRTLVGAGLVTGLVLASGAATLLPGTAPRAAAEALPPYADCDALLAHYRAELERTATPYGLGGGGFGIAESRASGAGGDLAVAAPSAASADESAPTGTNLQEAGVDEPDIAKTVGGLLFAISDRGLEVVRTGARPQLLGSVPLGSDTWGAELLVDGDRVLVLVPGHGPVPGLAGDEPAVGRMAFPVSGRTSALLFDVAEPAQPRLLERLELDGRYLSARLSGGTVRLVTSSMPDVVGEPPPEPYGPAEETAALRRNRELARTATLEDVLPSATRLAADGAVLESGPAVDCGQVRHATSPQGVSTLLVTTLDLSAGLAAQDRTGVTTDGELVYASADRLYVATSRWGTGPQPWDDTSRPAGEPDGVTTELHGFDTTVAGRTTYAGTGSVPGYVLGRWALSSHEGHLRVAVTSSAPWGGALPETSSSVVVLAETGAGLVETGRVDGLGLTETIRAVRYFGDLAVVVTFRQTDPLYVLDLADPAAPALLGELKVPGFSTYLHPVGEDLLMGVGEEADESGRVTGMQVSLFDLADRSRPTQVDRLQLGQVWSEALHDSRAFGYDAGTGTALLSVQSWDGAAPGGVLGIRVQDRGLVPAGRLPSGPPQLGGAPVQRVLHDGTHLYAVSRSGVQAAALLGLTATGSVDFGR